MGLNQQDFCKALILALSEDSVAEKFCEITTGHLKFDLETLKDSNNQVLLELKKFSELNQSLQKEVSDLREIVKQKDAAIGDLRKRVTDIEASLDEHEQYSRRNTLRVTGIPFDEEEDLTCKMLSVFNTRLQLKSPLTVANIDRIHRVGDPEISNRPVLVKFATYEARHRVYSKRKLLRKQPLPTPNEDSDETSHSSPHQDENDPDPVPIYINEDLTKLRATLFWKARSLVKNHKLKSSWTVDGKFFVQDTYGRVKMVKSDIELNAIA